MAIRKELPVTRRYADPGFVSARLFRQAQPVMPGGNSRTSVFIAPCPPYAAEGAGCWLTDADGDRLGGPDRHGARTEPDGLASRARI